MNHIFKLTSDEYQQVKSGRKLFFLKRNGNKYTIGDELQLRECKNTYTYTGKVIIAEVLGILLDIDHRGLKKGYCVLSFRVTKVFE